MWSERAEKVPPQCTYLNQLKDDLQKFEEFNSLCRDMRQRETKEACRVQTVWMTSVILYLSCNLKDIYNLLYFMTYICNNKNKSFILGARTRTI